MWLSLLEISLSYILSHSHRTTCSVFVLASAAAVSHLSSSTLTVPLGFEAARDILSMAPAFSRDLLVALFSELSRMS